MAPKITKLNSMRLLESHSIPYEVITVDVGDYETEGITAVDVARLVGQPVEQLYKTLVLESAAGGKPLIVMIGAAKHLNLKKVAAAIGQKKVNMAAHADAERWTGLKTGGIGALALVHKNWEIYLDQPAATLDSICVSAGQRGVMLKVPTQGLIKVLNAKLIPATDADELL